MPQLIIQDPDYNAKQHVRCRAGDGNRTRVASLEGRRHLPLEPLWAPMGSRLRLLADTERFGERRFVSHPVSRTSPRPQPHRGLRRRGRPSDRSEISFHVAPHSRPKPTGSPPWPRCPSRPRPPAIRCCRRSSRPSWSIRVASAREAAGGRRGSGVGQVKAGLVGRGGTPRSPQRRGAGCCAAARWGCRSSTCRGQLPGSVTGGGIR